MTESQPAQPSVPAALSLQLVDASVTAYPDYAGDGDLALTRRLAVAAYRIEPTPDARGRVLTLFTGNDRPRTTFRPTPGTGVSDWAYNLAFSKDGTLLASAAGDDTAALWDATRPGTVDGQLATFDSGGGPSSRGDVALGSDRSLIATADANDGNARLWNTDASGNVDQPVATLTDDHPAYHVEFSPDSNLLATSGWDGNARLWDVHTGEDHQPLATFIAWGETEGLRMAFSPNGGLLATAGDDVRLWDTTKRDTQDAPLATLNADDDSVYDVAFSPDGTLLATSSDDGRTRLWDVAEPGTPDALLATFQANGRGNVAFSADGTLLATVEPDTGHGDSVINLWNTTGRGDVNQPLATLNGHTDRILSVEFSPVDGLLASGGQNSLRLWDVDVGRQLTEA